MQNRCVKKLNRIMLLTKYQYLLVQVKLFVLLTNYRRSKASLQNHSPNVVLSTSSFPNTPPSTFSFALSALFRHWSTLTFHPPITNDIQSQKTRSWLNITLLSHSRRSVLTVYSYFILGFLSGNFRKVCPEKNLQKCLVSPSDLHIQSIISFISVP